MQESHNDDDILGLPSPYQIFRYIMGTDHMHFGLFTTPDTDGPTAQINMMERLLSLFPEGARKVLDLGCGIGGTSCHLASMGFEVTGIAPEEGLVNYARGLSQKKGVTDNVEFHAVRFEDFVEESDASFDVILSQESLQYLPWLEKSLEQMAGLLTAGGRAVIGDQVLRHPPARFHCQFHITEEILEHARSAGFDCIHHEDVTDLASPSGHASLGVIESRRDEIIDHFRPHQPNIEKDYHTCVDLGRAELKAYDDGWIGYELFCFEKTG